MSLHYVLFFNVTATTEFYPYGPTLSLHDALPIWLRATASDLVGARPRPLPRPGRLRRGPRGPADARPACRGRAGGCADRRPWRSEQILSGDRKSTRLNSSH